MTTPEERPICQATKLPLPQWGTYTRHTVEIVERQVETTPDGTSAVHVLKAGTFCSSACAARWLAGETVDQARAQNGDGAVTPCVAFATSDPAERF